MDTVLKMDTFSVVPAQESDAGGEVAEDLQRGSSDDGRKDAIATGGEVQGGRLGSADLETPPAADLLLRRRNVAIQVFEAVDKAFDKKLLAGGFEDSLDVLAAHEVVEEKFDHLCETHGELAAATGGTWIDIATYKPASMNHDKALKK